MLVAKDIRFEYSPGQPVLEGLTMTLKDNSINLIYGHPTAGKTTFGRLIGGEYRDKFQGSLYYQEKQVVTSTEFGVFFGTEADYRLVTEGVSGSVPALRLKQAITIMDAMNIDSRKMTEVPINRLPFSLVRFMAYLFYYERERMCFVFDEPLREVDPIYYNMYGLFFDYLLKKGKTVIVLNVAKQRYLDLYKFTNCIEMEQGKVKSIV